MDAPAEPVEARLRRLPLYPLVPLRKGAGWSATLGVLFHAEGHRATVFLCNLFEIASRDDLLSRPRLEYPTTAAVFADGWVVD